MFAVGIRDEGFYRLAQALETVDDLPTEEMQKHFEARTARHIGLVQKYCKRLAEAFPDLDGLLYKGSVHDSSKFEDPELLPYIWLTWRYKCKDDGIPCVLPEGMEDKINEATEHHIQNNAHHPEFHQPQTDTVNESDRDAPPDDPTDATSMPRLDIAECVADWCAMSEERGNTPREWADKNINIRWLFDSQQVSWIYEMIDAVWGDF